MKLNVDKKIFQAGVVAFIVLACAILFYFALDNTDKIVKIFYYIKGILAPFIYGLVMAYLLCPIYNWTRRKTENWNRKLSNITAVALSMLVLIGILVGLLWAVIPSVIDSVMSIAQSLPRNTHALMDWVDKRFQDLPQISGPFSRWVNETSDNLAEWIHHTLQPDYKIVVEGVSGGVLTALIVLKNFLIGIIVCCVFLANKTIFVAQSKKAIFAMMKEENADNFLRGARFTHVTFGAFINGKIIDSFIIGILAFVFMSLFGWPYATLISVIIGMTNIIPFFGPFIGAIPSAVILFTVDPIICLYFLGFILVLQQFDGNILGPKILGGATGIPMFWVMFAILVGGGLFGFIGMVLGIPVFAVIFVYIGYKINMRLEEKGMTTDLREYKKLYVDLDDGKRGPWKKKEPGLFSKLKRKKSQDGDELEETADNNFAEKTIQDAIRQERKMYFDRDDKGGMNPSLKDRDEEER